MHQETGEEVWDYDDVIRRTRGGGGGYEEPREETTTYYDQQQQSGGYGGGGYGGGREDVYESEQVVRDDYRNDGYRREGLGEEAAQWAGRKVGEVEGIPGDIRYEENRVENGESSLRLLLFAKL